MFLLSIIFAYSLIIISGTYAYLWYEESNVSTLTGNLGEAGVELKVERVVPSNDMALVPLLDDALDNALKGNGGISSCIDSNHNLSCEVYRIDITNSGTTNLRLAGDVSLLTNGENSVFRNLKWEELDSVNSRKLNYKTNGMGTSRLEHNFYLVPGTTKTYYIAVWISENGNDQRDTNKGTFLGKVEFYSNYGTGEGITAFFGEVDESTLSYMKSDSSAYFRNATYIETIKNVAFVYDVDTSNAVEVWDMSLAEDKSILAWVEENEEEGYYDLYIGSLKQIYATNLSNFFNGMINIDSISFDNLDTSMVTNMNHMFSGSGYNSTVFSLDLRDNFNTENVTNMYRMFYKTGYSSTAFTLDLGDNFDTSNVTDMNGMFNNTGYNSTAFTLDLGDEFNTSNVINMGGNV